MRTKYFNDGLIGNQNIKASFTNKGELLRVLYGSADYKQIIDTFHTGIKVNDSRIIYLHDDINNTYSQEYIEKTNILKTVIYNSYFKIKIEQIDFVPINEKIIVKKYIIKNENDIELNVNFLAYSKVLTNLNNDTSGYVKNDVLIQYNHDFSVCTFSNKKLLSKQINGAINDFPKAIIGGKDYIGMSNDSAISYDMGKILPGEETTITLFIYINENKEINAINIDEGLDVIKNADVDSLLENTSSYWKEFVNTHDKLKINERDIDYKIKEIYYRSILLFSLLSNEDTGGISAGIEIDENKTKCGRYSYCWPRDAVFITEALDIVGMQDISDKFYSKFCKITQSSNGMWEQRFYTDGQLAPSWGYQIDETASVICGLYNHYKFTNNRRILEENLQMIENAVSFLKVYEDDIIQSKNQLPKSYDLWEEFEGISLYSLSAVYSAFKTMENIYGELNFSNEYIQEMQKRADDIKEYCNNTFLDKDKNIYVRNTIDKRMDMSIIGSVVPFKMFDINNEIIKNTIENINKTIKTYTGGYIRYENDGYVGGQNPWPIVTLWISWYYLEIGNIEKALDCFNFVTSSASNGFLGEQVDNQTMKPCWVIGLTWSHAMYIITLQKLIEKGII